MGSREDGLDLHRSVEVTMTDLLVILAFGSLLAVFWWVVIHVGTDPSSSRPPRNPIHLDREP